MAERTPRRNLRSGSVDSTLVRRGGTLKKTQFPFTEKWNNIVNSFIKNCPRGKHRRQFTYIENSFTGKEAVDFMMNEIPKTLMDGRPVARENCAKLLQKFLEEKHFFQYGAQAGKPQFFKDSSWQLYCFFTTEITTKPATPKLVRRGSVNSPLQRRKSPDSPKFNGRIPTFPLQEEGFNRRRSMSCNNLHQVEQIEQPRRRLERRSREPVRVDITPPCDRTKVSESGNDRFVDYFKKSIEKFGRRRRSPSPIPGSSERAMKATTTTPCVPINYRSLPSPTLVFLPPLNEIDMWSVYKSCLLKRLKDSVGGTNSFALLGIDGKDIKWNCEHTDNTKLVIPRAESDKYSDYVMRLVEYLMEFPFINKNVNAVKYDEYQETKVFNVLCSNLEKHSALLSHDEASCLLYIVGYFKELSLKKVLSQPVSNYSPRITRSRSQQRMSSETSIPPQCSQPCSRSSTPMSTISQLPTAIRMNGLEDQIAFPTKGSKPSSSDLFLTPGYPRRKSLTESLNQLTLDDIHNLPGLIISPEVEAKISEYFTSPEYTTSPSIRTKSELSYASARTSFTPLDQKLEEEEFITLVIAFSLVFLTIPTSRRWKLHITLRLMHKIANDEYLRLDPFQNNNQLVLEHLGKLLFPAGSLNALQIIEITKILMNGDAILGVEPFFAVDQDLLKLIISKTKEIQDQQRQQMASTGSFDLNNAPTPPNNVVQYCQLTSSTTYEAQNSQTTDFLLPLLDSIINDENMKPSDREKKLKQFRAIHPEVYAKRLPLHEAQEEAKRTIFQRVFRM